VATCLFLELRQLVSLFFLALLVGLLGIASWLLGIV